MSGQILQNNPILTTPPLPANKKSGKISTSKSEKNNDDDSGPSLLVREIHIEQVPEESINDVNALLGRYQNKKMTFSALRNVAISITEILQSHGDRLSYAYIPEQKIAHGIINLNIMKGHIERIRLRKNQSLVGDAVINRYVEQMYSVKNRLSQLEQFMSRITDLPGVGDISSVLSRGNEPGGSQLNLDLSAASRITGMVIFDNNGSRSSGHNRLGLQLNINSPTHMGDRIQAMIYGAPDVIQTNNNSRHGHTLIGRLAYDVPVSVKGWRLGGAVSRVNYKLGGPVLAGLGDGFADVASLYSSWSLLRSDQRNFTLGTTLDFKRMRDTFWGMKNVRHAPVLAMQFSGDSRGTLWNKPSVVQYQISPAVGRLSNSDDWNGAHTRGRFYKLTESASFIQALFPGLNFSISFSGQQASKNLDGAEQMSLGGPYAVRAYSNSAASVDSGWVASPALNLNLPWLENASLQLFYDYARGRMQKFAPSSQKIVLKGYGVGLTYNFDKLFFINTSYAWRQGKDALLLPQNRATGWITTGVNF